MAFANILGCRVDIAASDTASGDREYTISFVGAGRMHAFLRDFGIPVSELVDGSFRVLESDLPSNHQNWKATQMTEAIRNAAPRETQRN